MSARTCVALLNVVIIYESVTNFKEEVARGKGRL